MAKRKRPHPDPHPNACDAASAYLFHREHSREFNLPKLNDAVLAEVFRAYVEGFRSGSRQRPQPRRNRRRACFPATIDPRKS